MNDTICECTGWVRDFSRISFDDTLPGHHPYCDGTGQWKTEAPNRETTPELVEKAANKFIFHDADLFRMCTTLGISVDFLVSKMATFTAEQVRELTAVMYETCHFCDKCGAEECRTHAELIAKNERFKTALEKYADEKNWNCSGCYDGETNCSPPHDRDVFIEAPVKLVYFNKFNCEISYAPAIAQSALKGETEPPKQNS